VATIFAPTPSETIPTPATERKYRQGYRDGWIAATVAFELKLRKTRCHTSEAHDSLWDFHGATLSTWAAGDCTERAEPPPFKVPNTQGRQQ
jgi:hypothetical protein